MSVDCGRVPVGQPNRCHSAVGLARSGDRCRARAWIRIWPILNDEKLPELRIIQSGPLGLYNLLRDALMCITMHPASTHSVPIVPPPMVTENIPRRCSVSPREQNCRHGGPLL